MSNNLDIWGTAVPPANRRLILDPYEGDLRTELRDFLYGSGQEVAHAQRGLYRKMRVDGQGRMIRCSCVDLVTHEPDRDPDCELCLGMGHLWDESWLDYYLVEVGLDSAMALREEYEEPGLLRVPRMVIYTDYLVEPTIIRGHIEDRIVSMKRTVEGALVVPYQRERVYRLGTAIPIRSVSGRIEYWKFTVHSDDIDGRGLGSDVQ